MKYASISFVFLFSCWPQGASRSAAWGFFGHRKINRLAVFTLPMPLAGFYKKYIDYIEAQSVAPDQRRYSVEEEAARHYIDIEAYRVDSVAQLPQSWKEAVCHYGEAFLQENGIVPWHVCGQYYALKEAFTNKNVYRILKLSAELGHYVGDLHVPLHVTENYDGQLSGQDGIHSLWESRLPELFFDSYSFFVGKAVYVDHPQHLSFQTLAHTRTLTDSVLRIERQLSEQKGNIKFTIEDRNRTSVRTVSSAYAAAYHNALQHMVERQMRTAVKMLGSLWLTAWVDAGQPDMSALAATDNLEALRQKEQKEMDSLRRLKKIQARSEEGM